MGFRDIFTRKVIEQQEANAVSAEEKRQAAIVRQGVQAEVEPKIKELVAEVFESMRAAGWPSVPAQNGVRAHVYGGLRENHPGSRSGNADVVIDSEGRIAFKHAVEVQGEWHERTATASASLAEAYEKILASVKRTDEPDVLHSISINSAGVLMYCECTSYDYFDRPQFKYMPLEQYLAEAATRTVASRPAG